MSGAASGPRGRAARGAALVLVAASVPGALRAQPWNRPRPAPGPPAGTLDRATAARVDGIFARWDGGTGPGAAVAVLRDGRIVFSRGYGLADLEHRVPIGPRTRFPVASVSKQFTAFAIVRLAAAGMLSLADDIRRHLPEFPWLGATVTIENLLEHTSGIRDQWTLLALAGWRLDDVITQDDVLGVLVRQRELDFAPGSEHSYSNSGYTLLAEIVARTTGRPFAEWMREEVFEPLGLFETVVQADHHTLVPHRARSYAVGPDGGWIALPLAYATVGATGVVTTAEDLLRWGERFAAPGPDREAFRRMVEPGRLTDGRPLAYALGVAVGSDGGRRTVEHGGGDAGYRSHLLVYPDDGVAVAVLANEAGVDAGDLAHRVAAVVLRDRTPATTAFAAATRDGPAREREASGHEAPTTRGRSALVGLAGSWWSPRLAVLRHLRADADGLVYERTKGDRSRLRYMGDGTFRALGAELIVAFEPPEGLAERMRVDTPGAPPADFVRVAPVPVTLPVADYVGEYTSPELGTAVRVVVAGSGIALVHPRHGIVALEPAARDFFDSGRWWLGTLRFERDAGGRVTGFRSSSGRVRHLRFDRTGPGESSAPARFSTPPGRRRIARSGAPPSHAARRGPAGFAAAADARGPRSVSRGPQPARRPTPARARSGSSGSRRPPSRSG